MANKSFYIIDGHAQIFRAYFAPFRDLTGPNGEPTKATFVFTQMLLNLVTQRNPDYLAMVIDSNDETVFRRDIYPEYKANRSKRPDDFEPQEQRILQIVRDAGVPIFCKPRFEADDLIATMAAKLCDKGFDIVLVSKDKDLRQTLNACTRMYDVQADKFTDAVAMEKEHGYSPSEAIEVQTLIGDSTDNVPGIPGVGPKTAAKLIKQYKTADAVLLHLDELTPKMRESFEKNGSNIPRTRSLVTLKTDVDFEFDAEACRFQGLHTEALRSHLQSLGFTSLLPKLGGVPAAAPVVRAKRKSGPVEVGLFGAMEEPGPDAGADAEAAEAPGGPPMETSAACNYCTVGTEEALAAFLAELGQQKRFSFDTETDALGAMKSEPVGFSFSWAPGTGYYVPLQGPGGSVHLPRARMLEVLKPILEDPSIHKVGQNIKYDMLVLRNVGITLRGVALDSMIAASLVDASRNTYGMDALAANLLHFQTIPISDLIGRGKKQISMAQVDLPRITRYAAEDADVTLRLANLMETKLGGMPALRKLNDDVETPLIDVLAEMEFNGIAVDPRILKEQSHAMGLRLDELRTAICAAAGCEFNLDSPKQLAEVLFTKLGLKVIKRNKTGPSTDVEVLEKLADQHMAVKLMLEYRTLIKLKNTYLDNLPDHINPRTRRIHPSFSQIGAETGRLSCSDPNLQNIPIRTDEGRRIRLAFVPGDPERNVLLTVDYSQIELRMLAHFTQEPALLKAFEQDEDIHRAVAAEVFMVPLEEVTRPQRGSAKTINFAIIYGAGAYRISQQIDGMTVADAQQLINRYHVRFPGIRKFMEQSVTQAQTQGYVETILGRRRPITDINSGVLRLSNAAERAAANTVVQGSAADLMKVAMLRVYHRLRRDNRPSRMLLQVHDELVFETPIDAVETDSAIIREEMTQAMQLSVPLKVDVGYGKNWEEGK